MEKESLRVGEEYDRIKARAESKGLSDGGLCRDLWNLASNSYSQGAFQTLWEQLSRLYGKQPTKLKSPEEFWHPALKKAVAHLAGKERQADMEEMTRMQMDCQFSQTMFRRSYRSKDFGFHAPVMVRRVCDWIYWTAYEKTAEEMLFYEHSYVRGFDMYLALELRRQNPRVVSLVREAMLGDNSEILLSHTMIRAVVISGNRELLELLQKLLLAARLQEGLRQQILEQADAGSVETLIGFLKLCVKEDMFRYSSAVRALDVWTGLGYGDDKPALVKKYAALALECLEQPEARARYLDSENNLEAYFVLWAMACYETDDCYRYVQTLLTDPRKYRRALGWYFVSHSDSSQYRMIMAAQYLGERDKELLAWVVENLAVTHQAVASYRWSREKAAAVANPALPDTLPERRKLFSQLEEIADYIGAGSHTYTGNPFPFSSVTLENTRVIGCMMSLAFYDFDETLILKLADYRDKMNVDQRYAYYANYLNPQQRESHRKLLREALHDRSIQVKEAAVKALSDCTLLEQDLEALAESLRSKSSSLRKSVLDIFRRQPAEKLAPVLEFMLQAQEEYQIQAAIELLLELGDKYPGLLREQQAHLETLRDRKLSSQTEILLRQLAPGEGADAAPEVWNEQNGFGLYDPEYVENWEKGAEVYELHPAGNREESGSGNHALDYGNSQIKDSLQQEEKTEKKGFFSRLFGKAFTTKNEEQGSVSPSSPSTLAETAVSTAAEKAIPEEHGEPGAQPALYTEKELTQRLTLPAEEFSALMAKMNAVFDRHADYEYEIQLYDGSRKKELFGSITGNVIPLPAEYGTPQSIRENRKLEMIPFYEEFLEAAGDYAADPEKYVCLYFWAVPWSGERHIGRDMELQSWILPVINKGFNHFYSAYDTYKQRDWQIRDVLKLMADRFDSHALFACGLPLYLSLARLVGEENLGKNSVQRKPGSTIYYYGDVERAAINLRMLGILRSILAQTAAAPEDFAKWFRAEHRLESLAAVSVYSGLTIEDYFRACDMEIVRRDVLYQRLLLMQDTDNSVRMLTNPLRWARGRKILEQYPWAKEVVDKVVNRIVDVEEQRGELPTEVTPAARNIERFEGAGHFARLLAALGKENFFRGYEYSADTTKRAVLSRLLKRCYPGAGDTPETLRAELARTDISDNRLAEAVMYAPQWAGFAEKILDWPGLTCGVWFFHAHINETFSAEKETCVALYSPITPQQFNDGAFDRDWFFQAYELLGEKRFQILYKSAKYITSGSNQHRRSQLYTDAVLGRLQSRSLEAEITEKRNQEKLRCYPLIPIPEGERREVLHRYEFIQKFAKESRQFGAQRRESEGRAVRTALENLSMTAGFADVNRMTWFLESEKLEGLKPLTEPRELEGVTLWLAFSEDGTPELAVEKGGKRQKSLPKALQKQEAVLEMKEAVKELKEQKSRARQSLERAMVEGTAFGLEELQKISGNPVLAPMLFSLVWVLEEKKPAEADQPEAQSAGEGQPACGFLEKTAAGLALRGLAGKEIFLGDSRSGTDTETQERDGRYPQARSCSPQLSQTDTANVTLRIAHPHDLMKAGLWSAYMHELYQSRRTQPFKQVFREYYPITEDERQEKNISRRYAGYQVQPQKTVALLRGRGWTVDYEEGLQKVCYRENIIVRMYALADWFSPADIEAPTLEVIRFYDRKTGELMDMEKVPPVLFSEAMRDIDLAVSVAHVGGVDPEASHSTVEMRTAIARELVAMLKLTNVTFIGSHAKIRGSLANYSVHMGSGVAHAEAVGMLSILPVHSQARGRIFLPFADDDPKTAEIMSKIILLAEDGKIKDTSILRQIQG